MTAVALAALYIAVHHFDVQVVLPNGFWIVVIVWAFAESLTKWSE